MPDATPRWEPDPVLKELLFTDFDGLPAEPDDVIADALDGGYAERTQGLATLLRDEHADPAARFLACCALTSWADPLGYATVVDAAAAPDELTWRGQTYDRFTGQDDTFAHLAEAVGRSRDMVDERGTAAERIEAARALIRIADRVQLDRRASDLLHPEIVSECQEDLSEAVDRGIARLEGGEHIGYDLGLQLALFIAALATHRLEWSTNAGHRLAAAHPGERALRELTEAGGSSLWLM
ncbi:hypothetical protein [Streptomyces mangrovisoli]|uniref:Uncharacterized protein n=1 Tax=Streptomyces mangrovisoli TaxID=1428628 RepID=A0A1J4P3M3_9ACTN|nr:hypothetical protein [Streptomyces mangrovisoli]OIJ69195.1 hypothetical protein WN71_003815 [Streptomyces mangrovisoli]